MTKNVSSILLILYRVTESLELISEDFGHEVGLLPEQGPNPSPVTHSLIQNWTI